MGDTHAHFIRPVAPTLISESSEQQNLRRNAAEGLPQTSLQRAHADITGKSGIINVTDDWYKRIHVCVHVKGGLPDLA